MLSRSNQRTEAEVSDRIEAGVNRGPQGDGVLNAATGFAIYVRPVRPPCSNPWHAHVHAHSSTVMWDALSSLHPLRRGAKLDWRACCSLLRQYTICPVHAVTARAVPPMRHDTSGWGCSPAPGTMRMSPAC